MQELFDFLSKQQREEFLAIGKKLTLKKNQTLIKEGAQGDSFFVLLEGKLRVTKHVKHKVAEHLLGYLGPGETIGEMTIVENSPRNTTVKAIKKSTLLEFSLADLQKNPEIYDKLRLYLCQRTAQRLRYLSEVTVKSMEKEVEEGKKRHALGLLMITVLTIVCVYMLSLRFLENLKFHLPITTIISAPMVLIIVTIMVLVMKKTGYPWRMFGLRYKNWKRDTVEALIFSVPVILVLMAAKWLIIHLALKNSDIPLFNPRSSLVNQDHFGLWLYLISLGVYIIMAPLQELIVRGALQSGFYIFLHGAKKRRMWIAIILSNLIFSLPHLYRSIYFALLVLIPGLFWGWLFARQRTLVGVSVSHIFIGVWMIFIVGFEQLIVEMGPTIIP